MSDDELEAELEAEMQREMDRAPCMYIESPCQPQVETRPTTGGKRPPQGEIIDDPLRKSPRCDDENTSDTSNYYSSSGEEESEEEESEDESEDEQEVHVQNQQNLHEEQYRLLFDSLHSKLTESFNDKFTNLEKDNANLKRTVNKLESKNKNLECMLSNQKTELASLRMQYTKLVELQSNTRTPSNAFRFANGTTSSLCGVSCCPTSSSPFPVPGGETRPSSLTPQIGTLSVRDTPIPSKISKPSHLSSTTVSKTKSAPPKTLPIATANQPRKEEGKNTAPVLGDTPSTSSPSTTEVEAKLNDAVRLFKQKVGFDASDAMKEAARQWLMAYSARKHNIDDFDSKLELAKSNGTSVSMSRPDEADYPDCPKLIDCPKPNFCYMDDRLCAHPNCNKQGILVECDGCSRGFHNGCIDEDRQRPGGETPFYCGMGDCYASVFLSCFGYKPKSISPETFQCSICLEDRNIGLKCKLVGDCQDKHDSVCIHDIESEAFRRKDQSIVKCPVCRLDLTGIIRPGGSGCVELFADMPISQEYDDDDDDDEISSDEHARRIISRRHSGPPRRTAARIEEDERVAQATNESLKSSIAYRFQNGYLDNGQACLEMAAVDGTDALQNDYEDDSDDEAAKMSAIRAASIKMNGRTDPNTRRNAKPIPYSKKAGKEPVPKDTGCNPTSTSSSSSRASNAPSNAPTRTQEKKKGPTKTPRSVFHSPGGPAPLIVDNYSDSEDDDA